MTRPRLLLHPIAIAATLALLTPTAFAQVTSMVATGNYAMDGGATSSLTSVYPGLDPVDVLNFSYASASTSNTGLHSYGSTTGNFGSRASGSGIYQVDGGFKLIESITNNSAVAQSASFTFSITPGLLLNSIGAAFGASQYVDAGLNFNLTKNGSPIWGSGATLRSDSTGTAFATTGDASLYAGSGTVYNVLGVSRTVDLGVINAGETIELSYELTTFASGNSTAGPDRYVPPTTFTVPEGWNVFGSCGYGYGYGYGGNVPCGYLAPGTVIDIPGYTIPGTPSGSQASSGDPFDINLNPYIRIVAGNSANSAGEVVFAAVPEPESYALLLSGLAVLGWAARRRRT